MADQRKKGVNWLVVDENGNRFSWDVYMHKQLAVLMDIRDSIQAMQGDLASVASSIRCTNFQRIPRKLDRIGLAADKIVKKLEAK